MAGCFHYWDTLLPLQRGHLSLSITPLRLDLVYHSLISILKQKKKKETQPTLTMEKRKPSGSAEQGGSRVAA